MRWPVDAWPLPLSNADVAWRLAALDWTGDAAAFTPVDPVPVEPDGVVTLATWSTATWDARIGDPALVGFTLITHVDGVLQDADVVLNAERFMFSDAVDPRAFHRPTTLRHELGHVLALGHVPEVDALMHAAQEPGADRRATPMDTEALATASTCCATVRRPDLDAIAADDRLWAHLVDGSAVPLEPVSPLALPADTTHVEIWTSTGHGALFPAPRPAPTEPEPAPTEPAPPAPETDRPTDGAGSDCRQRPGSEPGGSWILLALLCWRRP